MRMPAKTLLAALLLSSTLAAPAIAGLPHYVIKDVGSFGGGFGLYSNPASRALNDRGANAGVNSTGVDDPFCPDWCFFDGYVDHAFEWKHGKTGDLGALADGASSWAFGVNDKDVVIGISETGAVDTATGAPVVHGVRWQGGAIEDLGSLGGSQSLAAFENRKGEVAITSETGATDPYLNVPQANCLWLPNGFATSCGEFDFGTNIFLLPVSSQTHAAANSQSGLLDLGTLGGPDSSVYDINDKGLAVGWSYTNGTAGASGVPDTRPVVWIHGKPKDMGSLGGTFGAAIQINRNGQATGASNLAGDTVVHSFVWDKASKHMTDLGSFGGWYSHPNWINDNGDVVGISSYADNTRRAFYWHNNMLQDLGTIDTDDRSVAVGVNNGGLIVGYTFDNGGNEIRGFISDNGGALVDINTLIDKPHGLYVAAAYYINDRDEIVGFAYTKKGEIHPVVLIPESDSDPSADTGPDAIQKEHLPAKRIQLCKKGRMFARFCATR